MLSKKQIAEWLISIANRIHPKIEQKDGYVARQVGIGVHISKNDVRRFRKMNPEYSSHRKGLEALIDDTKKKAVMNIVAGLSENGIVEYDVNKTPWTADVKAVLKIYVPKKQDS